MAVEFFAQMDRSSDLLQKLSKEQRIFGAGGGNERKHRSDLVPLGIHRRTADRSGPRGGILQGS